MACIANMDQRNPGRWARRQWEIPSGRWNSGTNCTQPPRRGRKGTMDEEGQYAGPTIGIVQRSRARWTTMTMLHCVDHAPTTCEHRTSFVGYNRSSNAPYVTGTYGRSQGDNEWLRAARAELSDRVAVAEERQGPTAVQQTPQARRARRIVEDYMDRRVRAWSVRDRDHVTTVGGARTAKHTQEKDTCNQVCGMGPSHIRGLVMARHRTV